MGYDTILFDMDGTVLDTLQDLWASTNAVLRELGKPEMKKERKLFGGITSRDFIFRDLRGDGEKDRKRFEFLDGHVRKTAEHNLACLYVIEPGRNFENSVFKGSVSEIKGIIKNFIPFCKEHHRNRQPVVIIDYLQIVSSNKESIANL